ncbi:hypothetical protein ASPSYDRAFT_35151 [Aspergillus sydowii CBS 593.65]|uniref:RING-type E3 ubiquitin transferase n=1 Tax=Aspergillus sydowii CBS 593.65 TaxID=1036612 RepID=A0A1L9T4W9_9EURO|nr:uncharacterized protein ASPSYDRAFT_35151 [Aspergillus sydowii CBS 593.65]OJJ54445.1 hypothetical protein ASPSYDRAFT_35151 [Aspergillus sydowii CBS 593.65]
MKKFQEPVKREELNHGSKMRHDCTEVLGAGPPIPDQQKPLVRPFHFNSKSNKQFREMVHNRQDRVIAITKELLGTIPLVKFTRPSSCKRESDVEAGDRGCQEKTRTEEGRTSNPTTLSSLDEVYVHLARPICAEAFADGEDLRILPCSPQFHAGCVDPWLLTRSRLCPMCRSDVALSSFVVRDNPVTKNADNSAEQMEEQAKFWLDWWSDAETQHQDHRGIFSTNAGNQARIGWRPRARILMLDKVASSVDCALEYIKGTET